MRGQVQGPLTRASGSQGRMASLFLKKGVDIYALREAHRVMHSDGSALGAGKLWITRTWPTPLRCCDDGGSSDCRICNPCWQLYSDKCTLR